MKKTYKYICGQYPIPMIMMYEKPNQNVYNENYEFSFGTWDEKNNCIWTIDAYLIYDENKIISYKYNQFSNLVWLLKKVNKPFLIEIYDEVAQNEINEYLSDVLIEI